MKNTQITLEQVKNRIFAMGLTSSRSSRTGAKFVKIVDFGGKIYGSSAAVGTSRTDQALKQFIYSIYDISDELKRELGEKADSGYFSNCFSGNINSIGLNYLAEKLGFEVCEIIERKGMKQLQKDGLNMFVFR